MNTRTNASRATGASDVAAAALAGFACAAAWTTFPCAAEILTLACATCLVWATACSAPRDALLNRLFLGFVAGTLGCVTACKIIIASEAYSTQPLLLLLLFTFSFSFSSFWPCLLVGVY